MFIRIVIQNRLLLYERVVFPFDSMYIYKRGRLRMSEFIRVYIDV